MSETHITHILDDKPVAALSESELGAIRAHTASCVDCARSFEAARISALLLNERTEETSAKALNANPFFQTRVLAAWREQQATAGAWNLRRLWSATNALIASMAATTAALAVLTFVVPANDVVVEQADVQASAEAVMLDEAYADMTNDQVLSAIYGEEDEDQ